MNEPSDVCFLIDQALTPYRALSRLRRPTIGAAAFRLRAYIRMLGLIGLLVFSFGSPSLRAQPTMSEYHVKALFILNFIKYVDWPSAALPPSAPIIIGVVGQDDLYQNLQQSAEGKSINGRAVVIKHLADGDDPGACAILFVGLSEDSQLAEILGKTKALPILTVGEDESFLQKGGVIDLDLKDGKIHLEINLKSAREVNLQISSKLLSVAEIKDE